jgi:hypothetical protein
MESDSQDVNSKTTFTQVAIIGTSGRKGDRDLMSVEGYNKMILEAERIILKDLKLDLDHVELVSGG